MLAPVGDAGVNQCLQPDLPRCCVRRLGGAAHTACGAARRTRYPLTTAPALPQ
jgi:hypothetical protein